MDDEITIIRGNTTKLLRRLERDVIDTEIFLETRLGLKCVRLAVLAPYAWSEQRPRLCSVCDMWAMRSDVSEGARNILERFGWSFDTGLDAADYLEFHASNLSNHRRLAGVRRVRSVL